MKAGEVFGGPVEDDGGEWAYESPRPAPTRVRVGDVTDHDGRSEALDVSAVQSEDERLWGLAAHFSLLAGYVVPFGGFVLPIAIWLFKKDQLPAVDTHGRNAINWLISSILYGILCVPLVFVLIGIPLVVILGILCIVFPVVAGLKAHAGETWRYPMAIRFL